MECSQGLLQVVCTLSHTIETLTKRGLVSDAAKTFDVLGWFSSSNIKFGKRVGNTFAICCKF